MTEPGPEQGTHHGPKLSTPRRRATARALPWLLAGAVLLLVAALAGLGTAYLIAGMRAAPPPDAAFMPTPTPMATPSIVVGPTVGPSPTESASPTVPPSATPTAQPTDPPGPSPTPFEYTVARGDSVTKIALRFGVTPESIIELNDLRPPRYVIHPDQVLLIPVASASPTPTP